MDDINIQNNDWKIPLHIAVFTEKLSLIKKLLKKGDDITIKDKDGRTPILLVYEITGADSRVMIILLSSKPNKSCFQNILRISNSNTRNKKDDNKTIITPSIYLFASIICWLLVFFLQLDYLPYNAQFFIITFFIFR